MLTLSHHETQLASAYVDEFAQACLGGAAPAFDCIYRSSNFPQTRLVLRISTAEGSYALKVDTESPLTGRLKAEFGVLQELHTFFQDNKTSQVVRPVYYSPGNAFFVTVFIDRPTAVDLIYDSPDDGKVAQVYRRAGSWLHDLHGFRAPTQMPFWPQWMMESIRELAKTARPEIAEDYRVMMNIMRADAGRLRGKPVLRTFSHGDFHGLNLILGQGAALGLDFTEVIEKPAIYDIVDFLKADVFRDDTGQDLDRSGILRKNKEMFFRRYRHPIDMDILDFCIRGRLLKDWLEVSGEEYTPTEFEVQKSRHLRHRLRRALIEPVTLD
ncbi:aminoglycoside phosphotransferase family protein [Ruegeria sp. 2012CJ41-6]|uniref:Aminoglycoside phosphotransferase family protein n=1 Tax=Ruegeria spongiae TaxID=2942209 RepID=A0ABT0Q1E5_9RHOB|nr:phosphotransferase [Ruegeria spongiae]MCL6283706.1 aminoglycoside phosphotransferase family protein [Ruegeria spongiae]